ncbi:hypothetical protein CCR75_002692 [Bremia lactucae]|uniref:Uncharacterized protein n=1 Tax=Bremia lactucae TaxID=4779 RepID=A0A976IGS8_BRELC|nr:hypothetical protein CCR75_002692 [Bremia lactucae]
MKRPLYDVNDPLAELYVCAVRESRLVRDGYLRAMTAQSAVLSKSGCVATLFSKHHRALSPIPMC